MHNTYSQIRTICKSIAELIWKSTNLNQDTRPRRTKIVDIGRLPDIRGCWVVIYLEEEIHIYYILYDLFDLEPPMLRTSHLLLHEFYYSIGLMVLNTTFEVI